MMQTTAKDERSHAIKNALGVLKRLLVVITAPVWMLLLLVIFVLVAILHDCLWRGLVWIATGKLPNAVIESLE